MDKAKGKAKEAYGAMTGDEAKKAEGAGRSRARQRLQRRPSRGRRRGRLKPKPSRCRGSATGNDARTREAF